MTRRLLILAEAESGCAARLAAAGFAAEAANEIAGYLSQATDLAAFEAPIRRAMEGAGVEVRRLGIYRLETGGGGETGGAFLTMADNRTLSGTADTAGAASASRAGSVAFVPRMVDLAVEDPAQAEAVAGMARRLVRGLGLRDVFSLDVRIPAEGGRPVLLEFEVCPAVTIYDFRRYLADHWGCDLPEALVRAVAAAFGRPPDI